MLRTPALSVVMPVRNRPVQVLGYKLDEIDKRILRALQRDGRMANNDLANEVGLSPSPCLRRVRAQAPLQ